MCPSPTVRSDITNLTAIRYCIPVWSGCGTMDGFMMAAAAYEYSWLKYAPISFRLGIAIDIDRSSPSTWRLICLKRSMKDGVRLPVPAEEVAIDLGEIGGAFGFAERQHGLRDAFGAVHNP